MCRERSRAKTKWSQRIALSFFPIPNAIPVDHSCCAAAPHSTANLESISVRPPSLSRQAGATDSELLNTNKGGLKRNPHDVYQYLFSQPISLEVGAKLTVKLMENKISSIRELNLKLIRYLCTRKFGVLYAANDKQKEIYGY